MKIIVTVCSIILLLGSHADAQTPDEIFLSRIANLPGDRGFLINLAHEYCNDLTLPSVGIGLPSPMFFAIEHIKHELATQGIYGQTNQVTFGFGAEDAYCPGADPWRGR